MPKKEQGGGYTMLMLCVLTNLRLVTYSILCLLLLSLNLAAYTNEGGRTALVIGITGQDGYYLTELLLKKNYMVHGVTRNLKSSASKELASSKLFKEALETGQLVLHEGQAKDSLFIQSTITQINPDEVYNLAAQSHVGESFANPVETQEVNGFSVLYILEALRSVKEKTNKKIKLCQASTSEIFDKKAHNLNNLITEASPWKPNSPYAVAKLYAHLLTISYRENYDIFACNGILFNHESPKRGVNFVTRKITRAIAAQACGKKDILYLGNLDSYRDWGFAGDYVEAMWLMLQQDEPKDFVLATGVAHSVREFVEEAYTAMGYSLVWQGKDCNEKGINSKTGEVLVEINPAFMRSNENHYAVGDSTKAKALLDWSPRTAFSDMIKQMVESDYKQTC